MPDLGSVPRLEEEREESRRPFQCRTWSRACRVPNLEGISFRSACIRSRERSKGQTRLRDIQRDICVSWLYETVSRLVGYFATSCCNLRFSWTVSASAMPALVAKVGSSGKYRHALMTRATDSLSRVFVN